MNEGGREDMLLSIIPLYRSGNAIFNSVIFDLEIGELISMYQSDLLATMN